MATEVNGIELYCEWYLQELKEAGFIKSYKRESFSILVNPEIRHKRYDFKTKTPKIEEFRLLPDIKYTYDYVIVWEKHAHEVFYNFINDKPIRIWAPFYAMIDKDGEHISLVDVKATYLGSKFGNNTTAYTFPILQKMLWSLYGIMISKAVPIPMSANGRIKSGNNIALFTTTFVPRRYHLTDAGGQARKINYRKATLKEYVLYKVKEIDKINAILSYFGNPC